MNDELAILIAWLQARPNNAALFASDTGFICQVLGDNDTTFEAEGDSIGEAIENFEKEFKERLK